MGFLSGLSCQVVLRVTAPRITLAGFGHVITLAREGQDTLTYPSEIAHGGETLIPQKEIKELLGKERK